MRLFKILAVVILSLVVCTAYAADKEMKVGFVYVSPIGDAGYSYAHDVGRQAVEAMPGVTTSYVEAVPEGPDSERVMLNMARKGYDVIFDDRNERAGFKFKDAELIGFPINVIIGARGLKEGTVELKNRQTNEKITIKKEDVMVEVEKMVKTIF